MALLAASLDRAAAGFGRAAVLLLSFHALARQRGRPNAAPRLGGARAAGSHPRETKRALIMVTSGAFAGWANCLAAPRCWCAAGSGSCSAITALSSGRTATWQPRACLCLRDSCSAVGPPDHVVAAWEDMREMRTEAPAVPRGRAPAGSVSDAGADDVRLTLCMAAVTMRVHPGNAYASLGERLRVATVVLSRPDMGGDVLPPYSDAPAERACATSSLTSGA